MDKNNILIRLSDSERTDVGKRDWASQSRPQKVFSAIWTVEGEVNNGGFDQYFLNSSAETAGFVVEALKTVGALQSAELCRRAIEVGFPSGLPEAPDEISAAAMEFDEETREQLNLIDEEFYLYPDNLTELLFAYVEAHPEEFGNLKELT